MTGSINNEEIGTNDELPPPVTNFEPPEYTLPYPLKINPHWSREGDTKWLSEWLLRMEVDKIMTSKRFKSVLRTDVPKSVAYCYPYISSERWGFEWILKQTGHAFIMDDIGHMTLYDSEQDSSTALSVILDNNLIMMWCFPDDLTLRKELIRLLRLVCSEEQCDEKMRFVDEVLNEARTKPGTAYSRSIALQCNSFADFWNDAMKETTLNSMLLLAYHFQQWFMGICQEADYQKQRSVPNSLEDFIQMRRKCGGFINALIGHEVANKLNSPKDWIFSHEMQRAFDALNDIMSWDNDICSFAKEALVPEDLIFNFLHVIHKFKNVTYQEAGDILVGMLKERIADLESALNDLQKITPPELQRNFSIYKDGMYSLISGAHAFYLESFRYKVANGK